MGSGRKGRSAIGAAVFGWLEGQTGPHSSVPTPSVARAADLEGIARKLPQNVVTRPYTIAVQGPYNRGVLGGPDLMQWLVLAFGGAMLVGNVAALVRPPARRGAATLAQAPRGRTVVMAVIGGIVTLWALASLLA